MNICFLSLDYPSRSGGGGVGNQVRTLGRALVERDHHVTVVALRSPGQPKCTLDKGVRVLRFSQGAVHWYLSKLPWVGSWLALSVRELERAWRGWRVVRRLHGETPFDVIEVTETAGLFVALFVQDATTVARLHGEHYTFCKYTPGSPLTIGVRLSRLLQRAALRRVDALIAPSHAHAGEIESELGNHHPPIVVIPNAIAPELNDAFLQHSQDDRSGLSHELLRSDGPLVLFVGRLQRCKGVTLLLEAARLVLDERPEVQFALAGGPHPSLSRSELDDLVEQLALVGSVHFLDYVPHDELTFWYQRATLCVLPSYYETFGIAALEPMGFGLSVVATHVGGLPEIVLNGETGVLVSPGNSRELAQALLRLLADRDLRVKLAQSGKERVHRFFDKRSLVRSNLETYYQASK